MRNHINGLAIAVVAAAMGIAVTAYAADPTPAAPAPACPAPLLTKDEAQVMLQYLDVAVKAGGLAAAGNAVYLANKLQPVANPQPAKPEEK